MLAALALPWLLAGSQSVHSIRGRLASGMMVLLALAGVAVAIHVLRGPPGGRPLMHGTLAALLVAIVASALWIAPPLRRALHRVRSPAFRASLARVAQLPLWFALPAAVMGGVTEDLAREAAGWAVTEARSGAAWLAAGMAMLVDIVVHAPLARPEVAVATILAVGTLGVLVMALRRGMSEPPA